MNHYSFNSDSKIFYLFRIQKGSGCNYCDYTICCGQKFDVIEAKTREEAIRKVLGLEPNWKPNMTEDQLHDLVAKSGLGVYGYLSLNEENSSETEIESCYLLEVSAVVDMMPLFRENLASLRRQRDALLTQANDAAERAEYERLKRKFES